LSKPVAATNNTVTAYNGGIGGSFLMGHIGKGEVTAKH
jgi:hypothetical protein